MIFNPLSANPTKWSDTLKQFVGNLEEFHITAACKTSLGSISNQRQS